jgi:hypothetical protein
MITLQLCRKQCWSISTHSCRRDILSKSNMICYQSHKKTKSMATYKSVDIKKSFDERSEYPYASLLKLTFASGFILLPLIYHTSRLTALILVHFINLVSTFDIEVPFDADSPTITTTFWNLIVNSLLAVCLWVRLANGILYSLLSILFVHLRALLRFVGPGMVLSFELALAVLLRMVCGRPLIQNNYDRTAWTISHLCATLSSVLSGLHIVINGPRKVLERISECTESSLRHLSPWTTERGVTEMYFPESDGFIRCCFKFDKEDMED